jgi:hypothetical protein
VKRSLAVLVICLLLTTPQASAQLELDSLLRDLLEGACGVLDVPFLCDLSHYFGPAEELFNGLYGDIRAFTKALEYELTHTSFSRLADFVPWEGVGADLDELHQALDKLGSDPEQLAEDIQTFRQAAQATNTKPSCAKNPKRSSSKS